MRPPAAAVNKQEEQQREIKCIVHERRMYEETLRLIKFLERRSGRGLAQQSRQEQVSEYQAWSQLFENVISLKMQHKRRCAGIGIPVQEAQQLMRLRETSISSGKVPASMKSIYGLETGGQVVHAADSCAICLEDMASSRSRITRMPCNHRFHSPCLIRWLMANHSCPMCRHKMPAAVLRR